MHRCLSGLASSSNNLFRLLEEKMECLVEDAQVCIFKGDGNDYQNQTFCSGLDFKLVKNVINTPALGEQMVVLV